MTDGLFQAIEEAHAALAVDLPETPLEHSAALSAALGCEVLLKCEHLQPTGSFKVRGASNRIRLLSEREKARGVTTASTGNHGQAVARAGARAGVPVTVYVGAGASQVKTDAIRAFGADLLVVDGPPIAAEERARRDAEADGRIYISPYNDLHVVAGQGAMGFELAEQAPHELAAVFIAVGGGGLIGGTGTALKRLRPKVRMVGVWPENSPCMLRALEAGGIVDVEERPTLSDGTAGAIEAGSVTYPICRDVITDRVTVTEAEIADAMGRIARSDRWMVEGAAGTALAGLVRRAPEFRGRTVAVVLCGRNVALETFLKAVG